MTSKSSPSSMQWCSRHSDAVSGSWTTCSFSSGWELPRWRATRPTYSSRSTPATLTFPAASGNLIRSFNLHLKTKGNPEPPSDNPAVTRKRAQETATAVEPGMNHFQWDLTYPDAVDVNGIYNSGFAASPPVGPEVVPGPYYVTLTYGGQTQKQPFVVKLDPQLPTTQAELQQ